jgi:pSer/pThr/pTyr-binding forkhead associated (FHA) protein
MRIVFLHADREAFAWTQPRLRIGAADDNDLVLQTAQMAPHHLCIEQDRRGWVLRVLPDAGRVYVNARPVRERALVRAGDIVSIGDGRLLLCTDESPVQRDARALPPGARRSAALRAVAGPLSGRVAAIGEGFELGPHGRWPLELSQGESATLSLAWRDDLLWLAVREVPARHPLRVNGVVVAMPVALQPGDQLGLATHRFVFDAPAHMQTAMSEESPAEIDPLPEETAGPRGEVWWLVATAAVLAFGIALMLLIRF